MVGFFLIVAALFLAAENFFGYITLIGILVILSIGFYKLSDYVSEGIIRKVINKEYKAKESLIPLVMKDGELVPDIVSDFLNPPATIVFYREKALESYLISVNYIFNKKQIFKL